MSGARFDAVEARRPDLRRLLPVRFAARLEGQTVRALGRRGKYLLADISSGDTLLMHLGMSGSFRVSITPDGDVGAHDHIVFRMSSGATVVFNDPRRFGVMDLVAGEMLDRHPALASLGPEPLSPLFDAAGLARACARRKTSLKAALVDQRIAAGLGNIYAVEALYRARLSPRRRAATISTPAGRPRDTAHRLVAAIKKVLSDAIRRSVAWQQDESEARDTYFPSRFRVYDREGARCRTTGCGGRIKRIVQAGRSTFYCPVCQR